MASWLALEALLRWDHPKRGIIAPAKFIPIAEETGLVVPLGKWVLNQACQQLAAWRRAGYHRLRMARKCFHFGSSNRGGLVTDIFPTP